MVGPSKILTVSYGTFSCTLEGFDEPFSTMRGIAEYFRDLAADDRYFGAEPPTPDAEMLHRIAEREIQHRVEARVDDAGITLRQLDDDQAQAPADQDVVPEVAEAAVAPVATADVVEPVIEDAPDPQEDDFEEIEEPAAQETESVAAKLARIRAAVSRPIYHTDHSYAEEQQTDEMFATAPISAAFDDVDDEIADEDDTSDVAEAFEADQEDASVAVSEIEEPVAEFSQSAEFEEEYEVEAEAEQEENAEQDADDTPESPDVVANDFEDEDEDLEAGDLETSEFDAGIVDIPEDDAEIEEAPVAEHDSEMDAFEEELEAEGEAQDEAQDDAFANVMASLSDDQDVAETDFETEAETEVEFEAEAEAEAEVEEEVEAEGDTETEAFFGDTAMSHMSDMREDSLDLEGEADDQDASFDDDEPEIEMVEDDQSTHVLTDAESDVEVETEAEAEEHVYADADHSAELDDVDADEPEMQGASDFDNVAEAEDAPQDEDQDDTADGGLSMEDEAELMATLRLVQQENDAESRADKEGRALLESQDIEQDGKSVSRILDVTNQELDETEGTRRRSAIAHLKAAVLATRADKILSKNREEGEDGSEMSQYRDDLARVVRPRRPDNPSERRMAPLMLVSEQRVDIEETVFDADAEAVRPRRVTSVDDEDTQGNGSAVDLSPTDMDEGSILTDSNSFGEFADRMGATELPDLLEAAAAYASYVEGLPHFSRPQIMKAVQNFDEDQEFSREESLRSFGQLLRRGKIQKLKRGQFTISQNTRFNPEARAAGE